MEDVRQKRVVFSGLDKNFTLAAVDDRCGNNKKEIEYNLEKEMIVTENITKLPDLSIVVTVKRYIIWLMDGVMDDTSYEIDQFKNLCKTA